MQLGVKAQLLDELFRVDAQAAPGDLTFHTLKCCYIRIILDLTKDDKWRQRLTQNVHVQQGTRLFLGV